LIVPLPPWNVEGDGDLLDRHYLADQLDEIADRAAKLAGI